jgi:hypothetical protein
MGTRVLVQEPVADTSHPYGCDYPGCRDSQSDGPGEEDGPWANGWEQRSQASGQCWCVKCGDTVMVNSAICLRHGWPLCCGQTMTIDSPQEREAFAKRIEDMTPAEFARDLQQTAERETPGFPGFPGVKP